MIYNIEVVLLLIGVNWIIECNNVISKVLQGREKDLSL